MKFKILYQSIVVFVLLIISASQSAWSQAKVDVKTDAERILIGDQFHLYIQAEIEKNNGQLIWAAIPKFEGLEIVDSGRVDSVAVNDKWIYRQTFTLTGFDSGMFEIPELDFEVKSLSGQIRTVSSESILIKVNTIAVDTSKPIKPLKKIDLNDVKSSKKNYWLYIIIAALIFIPIVWLLIKYFKKTKAKEKIAHEMSYDKAMRQLNALAQQPVDEDHQKQYYTQLTQIIRTYLHEKFGFSVAESTTEELMELAENQTMLQPVKHQLKKIFQTADLAKFAKAKPGADLRAKCLEEAKAIVLKTKTQS